ncbi:MAG: hypothetical protein KGS72_06800 [Cyanobacteria bacterium REEB67]|nr:hypothetical protein [Cyanobacteria bacterium REEB67]
MHSNFRFIQRAALVFSLLVAGSVLLQPISGNPAQAASVKAAAGDAKPAAAGRGDEEAALPQKNLSAPVLANLAREYRESPDDVAWGKYVIYLRDLLIMPDFAQANPSDLIAANPSLSDLHVKVIDVGVKNAHLWTFPSIPENHGLIFACPGKTTTIPLPLSIVLRDGRVIPSSFAAPAVHPAPAAAHGKKGHRAVPRAAAHAPIHAPIHAISAGAAPPSLAAFGRYLVLIGGDRQTNALWLKSYKLAEGPLVEAPELFASLPAFFSQNVTGKACFSGSDIVLTVQPPSGPASAADEKSDTILQSNGKTLAVKPTNAAIAGYKVVLKYLGGKFGLAGKLPDDAPLSVALAFAQNICAGRADVAKAWLVDPKLVSIPKYLGLIGKSTPPMRLVAMSSGSGSRYRMITSGKNDLIIDVGRITSPGRLKGQLAVKGLFVAPSDAYAAKMTGALVMPQPVDKPVMDNSDAEPKTPAH